MTSPVTWTTWFLWVAVCAFQPVFSTIVATAFGKIIDGNDPHAVLVTQSLSVLIFVCVVSPVLMQWLVLRRVAPGLRWWIWFAGALVAGCAWILLELHAADLARAARKFMAAAHFMRQDEPITPQELLGLPWGRMLLSTPVLTAATAAVPAWIFARAAGLRWHLVLGAAIAGSVAAAWLDQAHHFWGVHVISYELKDGLNGGTWTDRVRELGVRAGVGAASGGISGLVLVQFAWRSREDPKLHRGRYDIHGAGGIAAMLASILAVGVVAAGCSFVLDPHWRQARAL